MRFLSGLMALAVLGLLVMANGIAVAGSTEGAFLSDSASSVSQIVTQVEGNRLVALRYAKHFGTDPSSVLDYMRSQLAVKTVKEDVTTDMFYVDESQDIVSKSVVIKAGTKVFANGAGVPILQYGTGNPFTSQLLSQGGLRDKLTNPKSTGLKSASTDSSVIKPSATSEAARSTDPAALVDNASSNQNVQVALNAPDAIATTTVGQHVGGSSGGGSSIGALLPIGLLGGVAALFSGGGGSSGTTVPVVQKPNPTPVPEPSGLLMIGTGLATIAGVAFRKYRS